MENKSFSGTGYEFLSEKEAMWAEMLMQALKENGIPCTSLPVHGAGFVMRTGIMERLQVFVSAEKKPQAEEILEELFSHAGSENP